MCLGGSGLRSGGVSTSLACAPVAYPGHPVLRGGAVRRRVSFVGGALCRISAVAWSDGTESRVATVKGLTLWRQWEGVPRVSGQQFF